MDPEALPVDPPPLGDPAGVPVGTTVPGLPPAVVPEAPPSVPIGTTLDRPPPGMPAGIPMGAPAGAPTAMPAGVTQMPPVDMARLAGELAQVQRGRAAANERTARAYEETTARDRQRVEQAYRESAVNPEATKPWDANAAREQYRYDPVQAFGSIGSVFATIASAFTKQPMTNAMFGAAAAMEAQKAGNAQEYDRAYKAWHDNFKLALDRQKMQHERYRDSISLMQTNQAAGEAQFRMNALRFGDQAALVYLDNGMNKDLNELVGQRNDMAIKLEQALPGIVLANEKNRDLRARLEGKQPGTPEYAEAVRLHAHDWTGRNLDEDSEAIRRIYADESAAVARGEPPSSSEVMNQRIADFKQNTIRRNEETAATRRFTEEVRTRENREPTSSELSQFRQEYRGRSAALGNYKGTEAQAKNLTFATYLDRATSTMDTLAAEGYRPTPKDKFLFELMESARRSGSGVNITGMMANYGLSSQAQQFYNAAREMTAAILRKETGAAFGQGEVSNTINRYIEGPGDSPEHVRQKAESRRQQREVTWAGTGLPPASWSLDAAKVVLSGGVPGGTPTRQPPPVGTNTSSVAPATAPRQNASQTTTQYPQMPADRTAREAGKTYMTPRHGPRIWGGDGNWYTDQEWASQRVRGSQ